MALFDKLLVGGFITLVAAGIRGVYRDAQETKRRKSSPLSFDRGMSQQEFIDVAAAIAKGTPRVVRVETSGMTVVLEVRSISGLSTWEAEIDFNDYGQLTGSYWLTSDNDQSPIPDHFADALQEEIRKRII